MTDGLFRTGDVAITEDPNGNMLLMNGQHTLSAVIETGQPIAAKVERYQCPKSSDLSLLFRQFDFESKSRSLAEASWVEATTLGLSWSKRTVSLVVSGGVFLGNVQHKDKSAKVLVLRDWISEGTFIDRLLTSGGPTAHLKRGACVAAIMATYQKDAEAAITFWTSVVHGEDLKRSMPACVLRNWLMSTTVDTGRGTLGGKLEVVSSAVIYAKCIVAWNAFRTNKPTKLRIYKDKDTPTPI